MNLPHVRGHAENEEDLAPLISGLYERVQTRSKDSEDPTILLMIDDADVLSKRLSDFTLKDQLSAIVRQGGIAGYTLSLPVCRPISDVWRRLVY